MPDGGVWDAADTTRADGKVSDQQPEEEGPPDDWEHIDLYRSVEAALYAVPAYFRSELNVVDVEAPDLFQFNTPLGGAIELQTVRALNELRSLWDPDSNYPDYTFVRQTRAMRVVSGSSPRNSMRAFRLSAIGELSSVFSDI